MLKVQKIIELLIVMVLLYASYSDIKNKTIKIIDVIVVSVLSLMWFLIDKKIQVTKFLIVLSFVIVLLIAAVLLKQAVGYADVIILGSLSLLLPYYKILIFLFLSFLTSGLGGVVILIRKKKIKNLTIPFLPYITISFIASLFM